ncbi:MAG: response regulator [Bacteroidia bacterium]
MVKIIIADDHSIIRDGITALLNGEKNLQVIGHATNGIEVVELLKKNKAEVVIMDINMPLCNGLEATKKISAEFPGVRVIALTMYDQSDSIKSMVDAGAWGYLLKDSTKEELIMAIESVAQGRKYFNNAIFDMLLMNSENTREEQQPGNSILTTREKEVLKMIAEEYTSQEIADKLFLSIKTVNAHRRNLIQKLGTKNTAGLVKYALIQGLIKLKE